MTARVSFICPVHDRPALLRAALASCLAQTMNDWEAVVVDDHSVDDIEGVVSSFDDPRIRYFRQTPDFKGVAAARELAIEAAESNILITLDGDDINHPNRAYRCFETLNEDSARVI